MAVLKQLFSIALIVLIAAASFAVAEKQSYTTYPPRI
uniref:Uncharacterized protein n=1 Tax=Anopheles minimus TaxID=112268 RepID=A0A182WN84_9DIPT